jgi:LysM repeat protein
VAVVLVFVALILSAFVALGARTAATPETGTPVQTVTVVVRPGDTLWQIAAAHSSSGDLRDAVRAIEQLNGLSDASIVAGQKLYVPVGR